MLHDRSWTSSRAKTLPGYCRGGGPVVPDVFGHRTAGSVTRPRNVSARFDGQNQCSHQMEAYQFKGDAETTFLAPGEPIAAKEGAAHSPGCTMLPGGSALKLGVRPHL